MRGGTRNLTPNCVGRVVQVPRVPIFLRDDLQGEEVLLLAETDTLGSVGGPQDISKHEQMLSFLRRGPCLRL